MKIDYGNKIKHNWRAGDVIHATNDGLYLVAKVADLDFEMSGNYAYTLIDLSTGTGLISCDTISELQKSICDRGDYVLNGTFKYVDEG